MSYSGAKPPPKFSSGDSGNTNERYTIMNIRQYRNAI